MERGRTTYRTHGSRGRRRRPPPAPPFRAWGVALSFLAVAYAWVGVWTGATVALLLLVFYLLAVRLTRCRVQTRQGTPCRWLVRGFLGTCEWHHGLKRGLPHLVRVRRSVMPAFLWTRPDVAVEDVAMDPQPAIGAGDAAATAPGAGRPMYDWLMLAFTAISTVVAAVSFAYQVVAG